MKKIKLYIATSIDGYIARPDGSLDWLDAVPNPNNLDYGYYEFYDSVDTVVMGRKTYEEVLRFGVEWPYSDCQSFVVSAGTVDIRTEKTFLLNENLESKMKSLVNEQGKDIWLIGGGGLITSMLNLGLVDEMLITITPIILGEGIPLFPDKPVETKFELVKTVPFETGFVNLVYKKI